VVSTSSRSAGAPTTGSGPDHEQTTAREIRVILTSHGRLSVPVEDLGDTTDLHSAGLTSLATVSLMLALEERFNIEFPDALLSRKTFSSINALAAAIDSLRSPDSER
jgi:acyl carrier protein